MKKRKVTQPADEVQALLPFMNTYAGKAQLLEDEPIVTLVDPEAPPQACLCRRNETHAAPPQDEEPELPDCSWSRSVALDPRHRPQEWDEPSATVRREWCRYPQEAHLLDHERWRYRRLTVEEIAIIQGFPPSWFDIPQMSNRNRLRAIGDAVPPPLSRVIMEEINRLWTWKRRTAVEICAGAGGLASGTAAIEGMEHLALVDQWEPSSRILRQDKPWPAERVVHANVREYDFTQHRKRVGLLSGGPPCQPWSIGGQHGGASDPRDLLSRIHEMVAAVEPEVFVFENVPGVAGEQHSAYLSGVLDRLRRPSGTLRYGVMAGILNAADYGVPQIRRRVFFIGFRDSPSSLSYRLLDRVSARATHRNPAIPHPSRHRWVTLREALGYLPDPGGWRNWVSR